MVEYVNGGEKLMNFTNTNNTFNSRNEDGFKMWYFDKIIIYRKIPDNYLETKMIWENIEEKW